ncbi:MAG: hypothetical protein OIF57_00585 [Marinobacterium sp.]|nr:hypothetical protein [Marinobacterium sp.]
MIIKRLGMAGALIILTGCSGQQKTASPLMEHSEVASPQATQAQEKRVKPINSYAVMAVFRRKLQRNGPAMLCAQPEYLNCYGIDRQQCQVEMTAVNARCLQQADKLYPQLKTDDAAAYGKFYGRCLATGHIRLHLVQLKEISSCLTTIKFDQNLSNKVLAR